jgi:hypothetical protein
MNTLFEYNSILHCVNVSCSCAGVYSHVLVASAEGGALSKRCLHIVYTVR